jgi:hypothetical protein
MVRQQSVLVQCSSLSISQATNHMVRQQSVLVQCSSLSISQATNHMVRQQLAMEKMGHRSDCWKIQKVKMATTKMSTIMMV